MRISKLMVTLLMAFTVASCCNCRRGASKNAVPLTGTEWQLVQLDGQNFNASGDSFTLLLSAEDHRISGKGDCNRLMGSFEESTNGKLSLGQMASTMAFCPNQADEDKYRNTLETIDGYNIDGNMLLLFSNGELKMMMEEVKK